jgi:hypothetical protein
LIKNRKDRGARLGRLLNVGDQDMLDIIREEKPCFVEAE